MHVCKKCLQLQILEARVSELEQRLGHYGVFTRWRVLWIAQIDTPQTGREWVSIGQSRGANRAVQESLVTIPLQNRDLDVAEFVRTIQEGLLTQYANSLTKEGVILDLVLGNEPGQFSEEVTRMIEGNVIDVVLSEAFDKGCNEGLVRKVKSYGIRMDVNDLERVQKRFTKMLPGMGDFSYEERLDRLGLSPLERRRLRGDLIEVYKIVNGMDRME
eukprot:g37878.t1